MCVFLAVLAFVFGCSIFAAAAPSRAAGTFAFVPNRDGTITRFRADDQTGKLIPLLGGATDTGIHRPITLVLSADQRFLYAFRTFEVEKDGGSEEFTTPQQWDAFHKKPAPLVVFAIEPGGSLRRTQKVSAPGPIGQLIAHPGGRFVYALTDGQAATDGGAFLFKVGRRQASRAAGGLLYAGRLPVNSGMMLIYGPAVIANWHLRFSPSGTYLYNHFFRGFASEARGCLQRYRFVAATGALIEDGPETRDGDTPDALWEGVWCFVHQTAFLAQWGSFRVCRVDKAGRIVTQRSSLALKPTAGSNSSLEYVLTPHPTLPLVLYRGSAGDPYTVWRVTEPGKVEKVGTFASAFGSGFKPHIGFEPGGHFLYETSFCDETKTTKAAIFALSPNGTRATLSVPPFALPFGSETDITLVRVPSPAPSLTKRRSVGKR